MNGGEEIMAMNRPPIVGIFHNSSMAEHAIEELKDAGFANSEIYYSGPSGQGSLMDQIKDQLVREKPASAEMMARALMDIGLPVEVSRYCAREFKKGQEIVAVKSPGHEQDAIIVLRSNGGYAYKEEIGKTSSNPPPPIYPSRGTSAEQTYQPGGEVR
jgi:hypothetical protein